MNPLHSDLLRRVGSLIDEHQDFKVRVPEDTGALSLEDDLVQGVRDLLQRATALTAEIAGAYETEGGRPEALEERSEDSMLLEIGAQISTELAAREISSLAFVARGQMLEIEEALLKAIEARDLWQAASHADAAVRRTLKALIALESAIREYEGLDGRKRVWEQVEDSLGIRRLYAQFRRAVLRGGEPPAAELPARLRSVARRIAILRNLDIYPLLRVDDRLEIRRLQKRVLAWLDGEGETDAGRRLWEDVVSFARLLDQVNLRQELLEHDRVVVSRLWKMLFEGPRRRELDHKVRACLESLEGRDDELDRIILRPHDYDPEDLRGPLARLKKELTKPFETPREALALV